MVTKGHSLIEVLVALALASVVFGGAWKAQWIARQQLQLSFEQLQAITLISELHQLIATDAAIRQYAAACAAFCPLPAGWSSQLLTRLQFFRRAGLADLQLCLSRHDIVVSWQSSVAGLTLTPNCGGARHQQVRVPW